MSDKKPIKLRREVRLFAEQMELKLRKNDHKGHWDVCTPEYLLNRMKEEVKELAAIVYSENSQAIIGEAADVANFAMMIADNERTAS